MSSVAAAKHFGLVSPAAQVSIWPGRAQGELRFDVRDDEGNSVRLFWLPADSDIRSDRNKAMRILLIGWVDRYFDRGAVRARAAARAARSQGPLNRDPIGFSHAATILELFESEDGQQPAAECLLRDKKKVNKD